MAFVVTAVGVGAPAARTLGRPATAVKGRPLAAAAVTPRMTIRGGYPSADAQREAWRRRNASRAAAAAQGRRVGAPGRGPTQEELMETFSGMAAEFLRNSGAFSGPFAGGRCGPRAGPTSGEWGAQQRRRQQQQRRQQVDWVPRAERAETPTSYVYRLELPGVGRNVKTELKAADRLIVVSGNKAPPAETREEATDAEAPAAEADVRNVRSELVYGAFSRTLRLPADADTSAKDEIRAAVKDGVLSVTVPKVKAEPEPPAEEAVDIPIA